MIENIVIPIITALIGSVGGIIGALITVGKLPDVSKAIKGIIYAGLPMFGAFVGFSLGILVFGNWLTPTETQPIQLTIDDPTSNEVISHKLEVTGTHNLSSKAYVWLFYKREEGEKLYPSGEGKVELYLDNSWRGTIYVGEEPDTSGKSSDSGKPFTIIVGLADEKTHQILEEYRRKGNWDGIEKPDGLDLYSNVSVKLE